MISISLMSIQPRLLGGMGGIGYAFIYENKHVGSVAAGDIWLYTRRYQFGSALTIMFLGKIENQFSIMHSTEDHIYSKSYQYDMPRYYHCYHNN